MFDICWSIARNQEDTLLNPPRSVKFRTQCIPNRVEQSRVQRVRCWEGRVKAGQGVTDGAEVVWRGYNLPNEGVRIWAVPVYWCGRKAKNAAMPARNARAVRTPRTNHNSDLAAVGRKPRRGWTASISMLASSRLSSS